jgi:hypothetical protein
MRVVRFCTARHDTPAELDAGLSFLHDMAHEVAHGKVKINGQGRRNSGVFLLGDFRDPSTRE